jgi:hypothetical protein
MVAEPLGSFAYAVDEGECRFEVGEHESFGEAMLIANVPAGQAFGAALQILSGEFYASSTHISEPLNSTRNAASGCTWPATAWEITSSLEKERCEWRGRPG